MSLEHQLVSAYMQLYGDVACRASSNSHGEVVSIGTVLSGIRIEGHDPAQWQAIIDAATEARRLCAERVARERAENDTRDTLPVVEEVA